MGTQGTGRKRIPNRERLSAEDDALNQIAREAEARLAAKRAARAEAREIRMKELERQQKEIYQVQKKYYGLDNKWGDIEQWMEDSERYSRHSRRNTSVSDDEERMSVGSRGSLRSDLDPAGAYGGASVAGSSYSHKKSKKKKKKHSRASNGYEDDYSIMSSRSSRLSDESKASRPSRLDLQLGNYSSSDLYSTNSLPSSRLPSSAQNGSRPSLLCSDAPHSRSLRGSLYEDSLHSGTRRFSGSSSRAPSEYSGFLGSNSRASSRASSARASPVEDSGAVASFLRSAVPGSSAIRSLDDVSIPELPSVEERSDRDFLEKGSRTASTLSAATLASLGGTSSRRGSGDTSLSVDTEASIREIKEIHELKDQIQDVEAKHIQSLREVKDSLVEVEEKYRKAMVSNAQLDNEKSNLMYQVDTLKDSLMELEEQLSEARREFEEKAKEFEREKHAHSVLQFQFSEMKETLKQSEDLLTKHGIVLGAELTTNGEAGESVIDGLANADSGTRLTQDSQTPHVGGDSMLGKVKEAQLGGRDVEVVDSGGVLEKPKSPTVQLQKKQQGQTESLEECDAKMIPDHPSEEHVSSQNSNSYGETAVRESPEKVQSDSTTGDDEIATVDSEHNNVLGPKAYPNITAESETRPACHPEVKVVITGPEEEMLEEEESVGNGGERSEDVGERYNSAGLGELESTAEDNLDSRSVPEAIMKEQSKDGVEYENPNAVKDMAQEAANESFENSFVDESIQREDMSEDAAESSILDSCKSDKVTAKLQETNHLSSEQVGEHIVELRDREESENILESAKMAGSHVDEYLETKEPGTAEVPNMEQGPGSITMDSKESNGSEQKDDAQSGHPLTTTLSQTSTAQQSQQKTEEPPTQTPTKTPHQDRGSASGKKKKKKKKKGKKGGVQESSSKASEKSEDADGEMQENSKCAVGELAEQAEISSEEHLTSETGEKSETSATPEMLKEDSTTKKENKNLPCEVELVNIEETQILAKTEGVEAQEGCPNSTAGDANADEFEKEDSQLSGSASLVETQARNDTEEHKEDQSPEAQEAESLVNMNAGVPEAENESDPKHENTCNLKPEGMPDQRVEKAGESESDHVTTDIATSVDMGSGQEQSLEEMEMGSGRNKGHHQEGQGTQEYVPSSMSIDTEEPATAPSEASTTENIDSSKVARALVQEEPSGPLEVLEEKQPSIDKSVGQETMATPEEETVVKATPQSSVENHGIQECELISSSTETEELAAAPSDPGTTEDIDSCKEAESLVQEELTGPPNVPEENQPSVDNTVGQEREEPENVVTPEEEGIVKAPPEGSVESQDTQECELISPSTETEELATAPSDPGATEDIDSCKEAESLVQEELTGPPNIPEENQPSMDNTAGQEREEPENVTTPEGEGIFKAPPEGSVESQDTQECELISPTTETEELVAATSEARTTEDIDSSKEPESLVQRELTGPADFPEEKEPSVDNAVGQERKEPENVAALEEEAIVNAPPDGSVGHRDESAEGGQENTEDGNYPGEEHSVIVEGLGTSNTETNCQDSGRESGESAEQHQLDNMANQGPSKEEQQDTALEQEEKSEKADPLPQEDVDENEEEDENEEGESFEFEEDLDASTDMTTGGGTHEEEGAGSTPAEGVEKQEDGSKAEPQAGTEQNKAQENVEPDLIKPEEPECQRDKENMTREELETEKVDQVQTPVEDVFEEGKAVASAERNAAQRLPSQETQESVLPSNEQRGRKDSSKSNKKGKGKGKEDCRMS